MAEPRLGPQQLADGVRALAARDPMLAQLATRNGVPPLWRRPEGFPTLVKVILEQQVSLASAAAAFGKLEATLGDVAPEPFLRLDDAQLLAFGFSRQKASYCRGLAAGLLDGTVHLDRLGGLTDEEARNHLLAVRGVGPWTADVYLMFALGRPDVWPPGDRALLVALGDAMGTEPFASEEAVAHADQWRPWRSVAARMLWHDYLIARGRAAAGPV